jgi:hypothetical protein
MSESDVQRIFERLDGINQRLATIEANQKTAATANAQTADKLDALRVGGCVMGREHDRRLDNLESRPERLVAVIASLVAIGGAAIAWIKGQS